MPPFKTITREDDYLPLLLSAGFTLDYFLVSYKMKNPKTMVAGRGLALGHDTLFGALRP